MKYLLSLLMFNFSISVWAQTVDTLHLLPEIEVNTTKYIEFDPNCIRTTLPLLDIGVNNLGNLLSSNNYSYVRSYGPGALSGVSIQGSSSSQISLLWNGIPIQSNMNGFTDLSLIPTFFIDQASIVSGGSSVLSGSGNIGGRIELETEPANWNEKNLSGILSLASTQGLSTGIKWNYGKVKWSTETRIFAHENANKYSYINSGRKTIMNHARFSQLAIMQSFRRILNSKTILKSNIWLQNYQRKIPSLTPSATIGSDQVDGNFKTVVSLEKTEYKKSFLISLALVSEHIEFEDTFRHEKGSNRSNTVFLIAERKLSLYNGMVLFGFNSSINQAQTLSYDQSVLQGRLAIYSMIQKALLNKRINLNAGLRSEVIDRNIQPIIPSVSLSGNIKKFKISINGSRTYRYPTLNDLYWNPGGNLNLKPETGYNSSLYFERIWNKWKLSSTFFNNITDRWIQWIPSGVYWSPINLKKVKSQGIDLKFQRWFIFRSHYFKLGGSYCLQHIFNKSVYDGDKVILGKQIIQTPFEILSVNGVWSRKRLGLVYTHNFTGFVYTSSDNKNFIPAFHLANATVSYRLKKQGNCCVISLKVNNIYNSNYQTVVNRPMPLRNFQISIQIPNQLKNNKIEK